jgi:hypothetical protein
MHNKPISFLFLIRQQSDHGFFSKGKRHVQAHGHQQRKPIHVKRPTAIGLKQPSLNFINGIL